MSETLKEFIEKRSLLNDRCEFYRAEITETDKNLKAIERCIALFDPKNTTSFEQPRHRVAKQNLAQNQLTRLVFEAIKGASAPMTARDCAVLIADARSLTPDNPDFPSFVSRVCSLLGNLAIRGLVRRTGKDADGKLLWAITRSGAGQADSS